jgi:pimeloyl-ACP methyl ester carboxylesterase
MKKIVILLGLLFVTLFSFAQKSQEVEIVVAGDTLRGVLDLPAEKVKQVVFLLPGSGPTDRDGNNPQMKSNAYLQLSEDLQKGGVGVLRIDKRGIGKSTLKNFSERSLRFETFAIDAIKWAEWLSSLGYEVIVAGHSEGSTIGILVCQKVAIKGFVSISGPGRSAGEILQEQIGNQPKEIQEMALPILLKLRSGTQVSDVHPFMMSLFRPSVQPYLISWMSVEPAEEIAKLQIPVLVLQGNRDLQVRVEDAKILANRSKKSKIVILKGINHVLKKTGKDRESNMKSYSDPSHRIDPSVAREMISWLGSIR